MYQSSNNHDNISNHTNPHSVTNGNSNGHTPHSQSHNPQSLRQPTQQSVREPIRVTGIPSVTVEGSKLTHGDSESSSERIYTPIKVVGDGSFGTVWLVDWHGDLPPDTPLSPMQCGAGARPEWSGKRLVALKRMKKRWEGGWDECRKLKELESLRAITFHPNIIPLYDFFLLPTTKELYFAFESMEGNLYQLIKSRRGRPLAGGLVSSIFRQVVAGLHHIHISGYFHRDMKPENLLVTTTGLFDYQSVSPVAPLNAPPEKDVVVIVKLADFGLARETKSSPPYTEYVSTRWYRAPEVLLRSRDYSNPVDMWALGTIMAELINLKPLFPGQGEVDQVARICEVLGDPSDEYGVDARGKPIGGGKWVKGIKMARLVGFSFPKLKPVPILSLFDRTVPHSMIECISDLLKYDPDLRLTSYDCVNHAYLVETTPGNTPPPALHVKTNGNGVSSRPAARHGPSVTSMSPRTVPPSHSLSPQQLKPAFNSGPAVPPPPLPALPNAYANSHRQPFYTQSDGSSSTQAAADAALEPMAEYSQSAEQDVKSIVGSSVYSDGGDRISGVWPDNAHQGDWDAMDIVPTQEVPPQSPGQPMDVQLSSPLVQEDPSKPPAMQESLQEPRATSQQENQNVQNNIHSGVHKLKLGSLGFKKTSKWGISTMFSHGEKSQQNVLPPVDELNVASSSSTPSLKRTQSSSTDSRSLSELSPETEDQMLKEPIMDPKRRKEEAKRVAKEAEKSKRNLAVQRSREQARAVLQKRNQMIKQNTQRADLLWEPSIQAFVEPKPKPRPGPGATASSSTLNAAGGRFGGGSQVGTDSEHHWRDTDHRNKARRRNMDDDHSMSSSDMQSVGRVSVISFATVDSDPGPGRVRNIPSLFGMNRIPSTSSLRTSFDDFPTSARSSNSLSFEHQLATDFDSRASFSSYDAARSSSISESSSPPLQMLSLSGSQPPLDRRGSQSFITLPPISSSQHLHPPTSYEYGQNGHIQAHPPSPAISPHSAINPMFKVVSSLTSSAEHTNGSSPHTLPPFAQLACVAEQYPPLSPMSFQSADDS
ncbi:kinase-like protein [Rickenella mellea]|uniref:Kinase-like protein n=1 Tax=Rickenella mellea TaxID=50990 RepID=A0A4Y7QMF9_9AGAM|nr:kinase-like protein [Rickenella mellea]